MNHGRWMLLVLSVIFGGLAGCTAVDYQDDVDNRANAYQQTAVSETAVERLKKGERDAPVPADQVDKQQAAGDIDPVVVPPGLEKNAAVNTN